MKKSLYLVASYTKKPSKTADTKKANWNRQQDSVDVFEKVDFYDRVTDKTLLNSHTVIDVLNNKCVRTRFEDVEPQEIIQYFIQKYNQDVQHALDRYLNVQK